MKFYSITSRGNPDINNLFYEACEKRNIKYQEIDISNVNFYKLPNLNKVISSMQFTAPTDDFRSNVQNHSSIAKSFSPSINRTAVKAARALGYEFGGVDILISRGKHYIGRS